MGYILLRSDMTLIYAKLSQFLKINLLVFCGTLILVFLISNRLQKKITGPILNLVETANLIRESRNYNLRAKIFDKTDNELSALSLAFNEMLTKIREREQMLKTQRGRLEELVEERTRELRKVNRDLQEQGEVRNQMILKLRASQNYNESVLDAIPVGLVALKQNGDIVSLNPSFINLYHIEPGDKRTFDEIVQEPVLTRAIARVLAQGGVLKNIEICIPNRQNGAHDLTMICSVLNIHQIGIKSKCIPLNRLFPNEENSLAELLVVFEDITQQKQLMGELENKLKELRRTQAQLVQSGKMSAVGELAAGVAHEINNPLSGVLTYAILLKQQLESMPDLVAQHLPKFPRQLGIIQKAAERCKTIADNLLTFSRQSEPVLSHIQLKDVLTDTIDLIGAQLRRKRIRLSMDLPDTLPPVYASSNQLQQVFTNLILNAVQAMAVGCELKISATSDQDGCTLVFRDQGSGIPKGILNRIFDPFFTTKPVGEGTGLGLSIVYGIVKSHHGSIWVESEEGQGSSFYLKLPRSRTI